MVRKQIKLILKDLNKSRILLLFLSALNIGLGLTTPLLIGNLVNSLGGDLNQTIILSLIILAVTLADLLVSWLQNFQWFKLVHLATGKVRDYLFKQNLEKESSFFRDHSSGDLANIIINDGGLYAQHLIIGDLMIFINGFQIVVIFVILTLINPFIALVVFALALLYFLSYKRLNHTLRANMLAERKSFSDVLDKSISYLEGHETIRVFGQSSYFSSIFHTYNEMHVQSQIKKQKNVSFSQSFASFIISIIPVLAVVMGAFLVKNGTLSVGEIISVYAIVPILGEPIVNLTDTNIAYQNAKSVEERIGKVLEKAEPSNSLSVPSIDRIAFRNISVRFNQSDILNDFSLDLQKGDILLIKGKSVIGKSTLMNLLIGSIEANAGEIYVNDFLLNDVDQQNFLSKVSIALQQPFIFTGDVNENISFQQNEREGELVLLKNVAQLSQLEDKADAKAFSGGEKQRIGIARALYKDCELLILDEPTSALDRFTERKLIERLKEERVFEDKITIIITHGELLAEVATKLLEFEDGTWTLSQINKK